MVPTDPTAELSLLSTLYHSGAFFCVGIVLAYIILRWASTHVAWLAGGSPAAKHRAVYVTALLGGLALLAVPAMQGTTPNVQMIATAVGTVIALTMNPQKVIAGAAALLLVMLVPPGCASFSGDVKTMTGDFATCGKADLGQVVSTGGLTLLGDVAAIVAGNAATLEADLTALAGKVGLDAVQCAIAAVEAVTSPATGSGSAVASTAQPATNHGLVRAQAWLLGQRGAKSAAIPTDEQVAAMRAELAQIHGVADQALAAIGAEQHR